MADTTTPARLGRLDTPQAGELSRLAETADDLQMVLRCCERLLVELGAAGDPADPAVESLWTAALLSYGRCFNEGRRNQALTEADVEGLELQGEVAQWHRVLLQLRDHYADAARNPREQFFAGVACDSDGRPSGIAITSNAQPRLDEVTVRQTGAIAYALGRLVDERIEAAQQALLQQCQRMTTTELTGLQPIEVTG